MKLTIERAGVNYAPFTYAWTIENNNGACIASGLTMTVWGAKRQAKRAKKRSAKNRRKETVVYRGEI